LESSLSPKQLAAVVGVSESSLKRWADQGRLSVVRTAGGHRRIPITEAIRFVREANLPVLKPAALGLPDVQAGRDSQPRDPQQVAELLVDCLVKGQADAVRGAVLELYLEGHSIARICDGPLREALDRIGQMWQHDRAGIHVEHRATDICLHTLHLLRSLASPASHAAPAVPDGEEQPASANGDGQKAQPQPRPVAIGGAVSGDPYQIPTLMAACVLDEVGFASVNFGPDLPMPSLIEAAQEHQPRLVWLACALRDPGVEPRAIQQLAEQLTGLGAALALGGRGFDAVGPVQHSNVHRCGSMSELAAFARGLSQ
jgi:excisionase family DNA binding protein